MPASTTRLVRRARARITRLIAVACARLVGEYPDPRRPARDEQR